MQFELTEKQTVIRKQVKEMLEQHNDIELLKKAEVTELLFTEQTDWITKITLLIEMAKVNPSLVGSLSDIYLCQSLLKESLNSNYVSALTEEASGSDLSKITTTVSKANEDNWSIKGEKWFVFNAEESDKLLVLAKLEDSETFGIFKVSRSDEGVSIHSQPKMGLEGLTISKVSLDNVRVPKDALVKSNKEINELINFDFQSLLVSALALGIAESALNLSLERARNREQFGQRIGDYQATQFKIAEVTLGINGGKTLIYNAAQKIDRKEGYSADVSMAKLYASEVANKAVNHMVQIFGFHGLLEDSPASALYQSQKITEIYGQTSEIQRIKIAEYIVNMD